MKHAAFLSIAGITALLVLGAGATTFTQPTIAKIETIKAFAFPDLQGVQSDIAKISILAGEESITLTRRDKGWVIPERHGYQADTSKVNELIFGLADMRLYEPKTVKPERYSRLEVEDAGPGAKSKSVKLETEDGKVIANALIGKRQYNLTGDDREGTYLRLADDPQSWLATGGLSVADQVQDWLDRDVIDLARGDVKSIMIQSDNGTSYKIERDEKDAEFALSNLLPGQIPDPDADFGSLAASLAKFTLDDVRPLSEVSMPANSNVAMFETFDGIMVTAKLAKIGDEHWIAFEPATSWTVEPESDAASKVMEWQSKTSGWAFQVSEFTFERLTKPIEDWLNQEDGTS